jgi:Ca2+-binding EF-hand superfamily protein
LRGITPEQYAEIEDTFRQFDKSNRGFLEAKELKATLYSLGEERGAKEIAGIVQQYGADGKINYDGFREFMINLLGDTDSKDEILESFKLINRGDIITTERMEFAAVDAHDQAYLTSTAPAVEGGWNYHVWTDDVFSR